MDYEDCGPQTGRSQHTPSDFRLSCQICDKVVLFTASHFNYSSAKFKNQQKTFKNIFLTFIYKTGLCLIQIIWIKPFYSE